LGKFLGEGNFAKVYEGVSKKTGQVFALKIVEKKKVDLVRLAQEIQILDTLKHPHIMGFRECIETKTKVVMVCELLSGGELFDRILKKESYKEAEAVRVVRQLLSALEYAHAKGVVHRDLKPENVILTSADDDCDVKISDFGLAKMLDQTLVTNTLCGTPMYVAPEILSAMKRPYGPKVDIWAVGVITYILLAGYPPFFDNDLGKLYRSIVEVDLTFDDEYWADISDDAKDFISTLLVANPDERPDATAALSHHWLQSFDASRPQPLLTGATQRLASFVSTQKAHQESKYNPKLDDSDEE
jgi:calcium/calmodulin-dependent protein kinase I